MTCDSHVNATHDEDLDQVEEVGPRVLQCFAVAIRRGVSRVNKSCHVSMDYVTCQCATTLIDVCGGYD